MKLSALTFTPRLQSSQESRNRVPVVSLQELLFADLWQLWDKLQFKDGFRDSGERSQKMADSNPKCNVTETRFYLKGRSKT